MNFKEEINLTEALNVSLNQIRASFSSRPGYFYTLRDIEMYSSLILLPVGIMSNVIAFIIFMKWKPSATTLHLRFLAVSDAVTLFATVVIRSNIWANKLNMPVLHTSHVMVCRLMVYLMLYGYFSSTLILTSLTMERFLCVAFPFKVKSWKLDKLSKILLSIYTLVALGFMVFNFFAHEIYTYPGGFKVCSINHDKTYFTKLRFNLVSNAFCGGIMLILTISISILLFRQKRARSTLTSDSHSTKKEFRVTVMLLTVTCLFIILKYPLIIMQETLNFDYKYRSTIENLWPVAFIMVYLNHSTNFFIYFVFQKSFRSTIYQMFICSNCNPITCYKKESQGTSETSTSDTAAANPSAG